MRGMNFIRRVFTVVCIVVILVFYWINLWANDDMKSEEKASGELKTLATATSELNLVKTAGEIMKRKRRVRDYCMKENRFSIWNSTTIRTLTDPKFSFIYCRVNKAASSVTIDGIANLLNCTEKCMHNSANELHKLPTNTINDIVNRAYKFTFVREPYRRLFSTYSNKFYFPKGYWAPVGPEIVKRYRNNPSADSLKYGHDITFAELIRYVVDEFESGNEISMDEHVRPMHLYCHSCDFEYDFIGKLETMTNDWQYLVHEFKSRNILQNMPSYFGENDGPWRYHQFAPIFKVKLTLQEINGSNISIYSIYEKVWNYFQITGDISKHIQMPFTRAKHSEINFDQFFKKLLEAAMLSTNSVNNVKDQKREAMLQAYSTVPMDYLERLRKVVLKDCLLYGYDDRPKWLFDRNTGVKDRGHFSFLFEGSPQT